MGTPFLSVRQMRGPVPPKSCTGPRPSSQPPEETPSPIPGQTSTRRQENIVCRWGRGTGSSGVPPTGTPRRDVMSAQHKIARRFPAVGRARLQNERLRVRQSRYARAVNRRRRAQASRNGPEPAQTRKTRASLSMAGTGLVAGEVVVDALPYFDQGYEAPGVREAVSSGRPRRGLGARRPSGWKKPLTIAAPTLAPVLVLRLRRWWRRKLADTDLRRTT